MLCSATDRERKAARFAIRGVILPVSPWSFRDKMAQGLGYALGDCFMLKWVVGLCAALYLVLITMGEPTSEELASRKARAEQQVTRTVSTTLEAPAIQVSNAVAEPETTAIPAALTTLEEIESPALVSASTDATTPAAAEPVATQQLATTPEVATTTIRRVTGKRVNLRAGPSTTAKIVGRAVRNDSAELVEMLPSGWAKVYILETGIEAYISAQFLSDAG